MQQSKSPSQFDHEKHKIFEESLTNNKQQNKQLDICHSHKIYREKTFPTLAGGLLPTASDDSLRFELDDPPVEDALDAMLPGAPRRVKAT